jgi:hypothetical protein
MVRWLCIILLLPSFLYAASVELAWEHDRTDCRYKLWQSKPHSARGFTNVTTSVVGARSIVFTGISSSHKTWWYITAVDSYGSESTASNMVPFNVPAASISMGGKGSVR